MGITISTHPAHTRLTTLRRLKLELGLAQAGTTGDELLTALIDEATDAIETFCGRSFARAVVTESIPGTGRTRLMVSRTPVVAVSSIVRDTSTVSSSEYSIENANAGFIYREDGWYYTVTEQSADLVERVMPSLPILDYDVTYTGGYLLPEDDYVAATLSVLASTDSFNDSASGFPLVVAGDRITAAGWPTAANNRTHTVTSRTAAKIVVTSTLAAEASTDVPRSLCVRTLPHDLERACVELCRSRYYQRQNDPAVSQKTVGDLSISYDGTAMHEALPASVTRLLKPYRKMW